MEGQTHLNAMSHDKIEYSKVCSKCQISKPADQYGPCKSTKDHLQVYCRDCFREYGLKKYKENSAHHNERRRNHYKREQNKTAVRLLPPPPLPDPFPMDDVVTLPI